MKPYDPEDTFICAECGRETKEYYRSVQDDDICVFCNTDDDYDDYYEDEEDY
jgi:recombinational DNA repair protein (RecF pathway)